MSALNDYLQERKQLKINNPSLFVSSSNYDQAFTRHGLKHMVLKIKEVSGVDFTMHRFRHTFAVNLLLQGTDIAKLKQLMGHNDIRMTAQYLRALPSQAMKGDLEALTIDNLY